MRKPELPKSTAYLGRPVSLCAVAEHNKLKVHIRLLGTTGEGQVR